MTKASQTCVAVCTFCIIICGQSGASQDGPYHQETSNKISQILNPKYNKRHQDDRKRNEDDEFLSEIKSLEFLEERLRALSEHNNTDKIETSHDHDSAYDNEGVSSDGHNHGLLTKKESLNPVEHAYDDYQQDQSDHDHFEQEKNEHNHLNHDHSKHDHMEYDQNKYSNSEQDQTKHDHTEHDQSIHDQSIHDQSNHDHSKHKQIEEDNSNHGSSKHDNFDIDPSEHDHSKYETESTEEEPGWWNWLVSSDEDHEDHSHHSEEQSGSQENHGVSHNHGVETQSIKKSLTTSVWLTSFASICVISLVGLASVAAIPLLKGPHQDSLLQLLVSLAIGTLVGDALIHLLPHALEIGHGDTSAVWKGFVATMTIIGLFVLDGNVWPWTHTWTCP